MTMGDGVSGVSPVFWVCWVSSLADRRHTTRELIVAQGPVVRTRVIVFEPDTPQVCPAG
jgi:hypothetical protein